MTNDYTSLAYSKRLQELGFKAETDTWWQVPYKDESQAFLRHRANSDHEQMTYEETGALYYRAFSLNTVLEALPKLKAYMFALEKDWDTWNIGYQLPASRKWVFSYSSNSLIKCSSELLIHTLEGKK